MNKVTVLEEDVQVVVIHDGFRGREGVEGPAGPAGPQGTSIRVLGPWNSGATYQPADAVTWRSTAVAGVDSLYVLRDDAAPSTDQEPHLYPAIWSEIGPTSTDFAFGSIWEVYQLAHGFTRIGQPAAFNPATGRYGLAVATDDNRLALGVVREIKSADVVVLQAIGEMPNADPLVIYDQASPAPHAWEPGKIYYLSSVPGMLQLRDPADDGWTAQPMLIPTEVDPLTDGQKVALTSWGPDGPEAGSSAGPNPPPNPQMGQLWYRTDTHVGLYVWLVQDNGAWWVQTNG